MTDRTPEPQTADLVKRLRCHVDASDGSEVEMVDEAADAIEELTAGIDAYLHLLRRSLDVGPNTANPSREAKLINNLRNLLSKYGASNG